VTAPDVERWAEPVYLDASALVKLFVPEPGSDDLNQALAGLTNVIVSDLALTEMASALGRRQRERRLTPDEAQRLYREASRLHAGSHHAELTPPIHRRAERLLLSIAMPLRALDALHLATALNEEAMTVVTFDPRLRDAARSQGLFVAPSNAGASFSVGTEG
jgi:predicted nucleic acid-binding protein